jgi:hypothetical protein
MNKHKTKTNSRKKINKIKSNKKTKINRKNINKIQNDKDDFPYMKKYISKDIILDNLKKLSDYEFNLLNYNPINKKLNNFNGKLVIFKEDYNMNKDLYNITDYFSQACRVRCINNLKAKESPFAYFQKNKLKIYKELQKKKLYKNITNNEINYQDFSEYLYQNTKQCTNFNTTVILSILKLLKPKRYLDPSAGWGDRLVGAIAYGCEYTGVDPSECMHPIYKNIINELVPKNEQHKYNVIKNGFESTAIKSNYYDLVFTSPPFFDFELYENSPTQSIEKFSTLEKWLKGFLFPLTEKAYSGLVINGYFGLYISDYTGISFTKEIFKYISENIKGFKYKGDIHFWTQENKKTVRTIFFWQKTLLTKV